jgi:hypothetical protein
MISSAHFRSPKCISSFFPGVGVAVSSIAPNEIDIASPSLELVVKAMRICECHRYRYLADVRDSVAGIVNIVKSVKGTAKNKHRVQFQMHFNATGLSADDAAKRVKKSDDWFVWKVSQAIDYLLGHSPR